MRKVRWKCLVVAVGSALAPEEGTAKKDGLPQSRPMNAPALRLTYCLNSSESGLELGIWLLALFNVGFLCVSDQDACTVLISAFALWWRPCRAILGVTAS